jgi:hypothetical protein
MKFYLFAILIQHTFAKTFITDDCESDADCESDCCGFNTGKCAGPVIAQERDGGCGFNDPQPNNRAERVFRGEAPAPSPSTNPANMPANSPAPPTQKKLIFNDCKSDSECDSGCCGFSNGVCLGPVIAVQSGKGCGRGDAQPNDIAARKILGQPPANADQSTSSTVPSNMPANSPAPPTQKKLIFNDCKSDSECDSGCCGFSNGICLGPVIAVQSGVGCGRGDAQSNDNAARKILGQPPAIADQSTSSTVPSNMPANSPTPPTQKKLIFNDCKSDSECDSGCCGFSNGVCLGPVIAVQSGKGCGRGDAQSNDNAARKILGQTLGFSK